MRNLSKIAGLCWLLCVTAHQAAAQTQFLPNGMLLTPTAAPGAQFQMLNPHLPAFPGFDAGGAISTAVSPDGKTLLILTSGFNRLFDQKGKPLAASSNDYVFVEDISGGTPVEKQVLQMPNTYMGLVFAPDGQHFYVSGGVDDDIHVFRQANGTWQVQGTPISLGHYAGINKTDPINNGGVGLAVMPQVAGLGITADGQKLVAANFYNDTVSIIDLPHGTIAQVQLRPGLINTAQRGMPGGEYPFGVAVQGNDTVYISSLRDREIDVVSLRGVPRLTDRIPAPGNPNKLILNKAGTILFVACDNADVIAQISTQSHRVIHLIRTIAPATMLADQLHYGGVAPNSLALSPDERTLYVTNGGTNTLAVISLGQNPAVTGLIPVGYQPNAVSLNGAGTYLYVVNGKSVPGPNMGNCTADPVAHITRSGCAAANQYILQLSKAGFLTLPVPSPASLAQTTTIAAHDDHFDDMPNAADEAVMEFLHRHIHHIIYIVRENRTYDEELGDLGEGNGDAALAEFGAAITPNAHAIARNFVDFDNFYDSGEVSGNGWPWSTSARESDIGAKNLPVNYAERGLSYDWEGTNRNINIGISSLAAREAAQPLYAQMPDPADVLPGTNSIAAPDGPQGQVQRGYLWDAALRAGISVRNYGFMLDLARYGIPTHDGGIPETLTDPYASHMIVAYPANPTLAPLTDPYFRGFDNAFPDFYREREWQREFNTDEQSGIMPGLTLLRLMHDHLGDFKTAIEGVNTPETEMADNDAAIGAVIAAVAHSRFASSTLIFIIEDDAQNGPDHVDAHRSVAYIVGPYVRQHAVISTRYSTVNMLRTIEDILGTQHLSINDAFQRPMADAFNVQLTSWNYDAQIPAPLAATQLPLPKLSQWHNAHPASYWAAVTAGYDWHEEDKIPALLFNQVLWKGLHNQTPYPVRGDDAATDADTATGTD